ncbi:hypothetical protein EXU48_21850 [Occultella glacieicola]|uniref:DUF308 domain-containing protein n=1 Tax=Occultella glacieicola TaxID=2518684 RepID=A0ABY2DXU3_9MICO|nr:hypothetical protein [Occultella glacieicola]TDE88955.1 hypothetical protein EXU48_21850 [Occultella glacieicola]
MNGPTSGGGEQRPGDGPSEPSDADVEASWAEITARLGPLGEGVTAEADEFERLNRSADPADGRDDLDDGDRGDPPGEPVDNDPDTIEATSAVGPGPRDYDVDDSDDGFVPPEPEPLDGSDPLVTMAWIGAIGGPVATVLALILWAGAPQLFYVGALVCSLLGWGILLWRMPKDPSDDDGAVV